jgi:outer membrane lipoprotein-sorting protein
MKTKSFVIALLALFAHFTTSNAQDVRSVLDKCAAAVSAKEGVSASFRMESAQYGKANGTIKVKGRKFHASTPVASMWFDGKTQWTYLNSNNEVSVTTPTEAQLQAINPYNFINLYKSGFKSSMTTNASSYHVHLTAKNASRKIQELFITIDKKTFSPSEVKLRQGSKWTTFFITDFKTVKLADTEFTFKSKDFPTAEVIDLR